MASHPSTPWVETVIRGLVPARDGAEIFVVYELDGERGHVWWVHAPSRLLGMLIGRHGASAELLRRLLHRHLRGQGCDDAFDLHIRDSLPSRLTRAQGGSTLDA